MTDETNGAKEKNETAQDERPNRRRQILIWAAALLGGLTFALLGRYVGWTGFYAFALTCAVIPKITTEETLRRHKVQLRRWKWGLIAVGAAALGLLLGPDSFEWAVAWLRRHETLTDPWTFCWRVALECFLAAHGISIAITILDKFFKQGWTEKKKHDDAFPSLEDEKANRRKKAKRILTAPIGEAVKYYSKMLYESFARMIVSPSISETLRFQAIPIALLSLAGASPGTQVAASATLFALAHFIYSVKHGVSSGICGGVYLAFVYVYGMRTSFWRAFWMTSLAHALNNTAIVLVQLIFALFVFTLTRIAIMSKEKRKQEEAAEELNLNDGTEEE